MQISGGGQTNRTLAVGKSHYSESVIMLKGVVTASQCNCFPVCVSNSAPRKLELGTLYSEVNDKITIKHHKL